jgi:tetratricopeptide (TPR) repeat protein
MARAYVDADDLPRALNTFERAVAEAPYEPEILNDFARLLAENDIRLERADDLIERALEVDPNASRLLTTKGLVAERRHDFAEADSVVSIAITLGGPTAERLEILGDARVGLGRFDEGLAAWQESLRIALGASGENSAVDRSRVKRLREKIDRAGGGRENNGANGAE